MACPCRLILAPLSSWDVSPSFLLGLAECVIEIKDLRVRQTWAGICMLTVPPPYDLGLLWEPQFPDCKIETIISISSWDCRAALSASASPELSAGVLCQMRRARFSPASAPQGTFSNVWRSFWLSGPRKGLLVASSGGSQEAAQHRWG